MIVQIEKNVIMPSKANRRIKRSRPVKWNWPLAKMEIGDSIYVPITEFSESVQTGKDYIFEGTKTIGARIWRVK